MGEQRSNSLREKVVGLPESRFLKDQWVLAHGGVYASSREAGRTGYLRVRAHFLAEEDLAKLKRFLRSREAHFEDERDTREIEGFFAGEFPWHRRIPYAEPESVRVPVGRRKVLIPQCLIPQVRLTILSLGEKELRIGGEKQPAWHYETVYEFVEMIPLVQRSVFGERSALERPSGLVPSKQIAEFAGMWLRLPMWNMIDSSGRPASFAMSVQETLNSSSSLLIRKDIVRAYMKQMRSRVV